MAVELRLRRVGLAELQMLVLAHQGAGERTVAVLHLRGRSEDRGIEIRDAFRGADRHVELHVGNSERDAPEARRIRLIAAHAIAPRARRLDIIVVFGKAELRAVELRLHARQAIEQRVAALDDEAGVAAHDLRLARSADGIGCARH